MPTKTASYLQDLDRKHHLHPFTNHVEMHADGTHVITSAKGVWIVEAGQHRAIDPVGRARQEFPRCQENQRDDPEYLCWEVECFASA